MNYSYFFNNIFPIIFLVSSGILIRQLLIYVDQIWAKTFHHSLTLILLPVVTFIITKAISGNIALSLGMIGALSIVRFRNPVKNPFELVIFFCMITLGISAGVQIKLAALLLLTTLVVIAASKIYVKINKKGFIASFEEGYSLNIIEIISSKEIEELKNFNILSFSFDKDRSTYEYKISERNKDEIHKIERIIKGNDQVLNYEIRYSFD